MEKSWNCVFEFLWELCSIITRKNIPVSFFQAVIASNGELTPNFTYISELRKKSA